MVALEKAVEEEERHAGELPAGAQTGKTVNVGGGGSYKEIKSSIFKNAAKLLCSLKVRYVCT